MREKAIIVGLTVAMLSSTSYALDPLGPPKALLGQDHWSLGVEYAYSETDVDLSDGTFLGSPMADASSQLQANRAYANLRYGLRDNLDVFARLGAATFEMSLLQEGDADLAWGLGAAGTLYNTVKLDWGLLVQYSSGESKGHGLPPVWTFASQVEVWTLQVATGPTYQVREDLAVYGGLFYDMLTGEYEGNALEWDLQEDDRFGGFVGLDWELKEDTYWTVELQYAGSTFAIATGLRWTFD